MYCAHFPISYSNTFQLQHNVFSKSIFTNTTIKENEKQQKCNSLKRKYMFTLIRNTKSIYKCCKKKRTHKKDENNTNEICSKFIFIHEMGKATDSGRQGKWNGSTRWGSAF